MLRPWTFRVAIDVSSRTAIYMQIAHAVIEDIQRGRLVPGSPMPGTRELAKTLSLNRKTVLAAYEELEAQGWLISERMRGSFVSRELPIVTPKPFAPRPTKHPVTAKPRFRPSGQARSITVDLPEPGVLAFNDGWPDTRLVPIAALARAYRSALIQLARRNRLGYGDPRGTLALRQAISALLNGERGLATTPDTICITRGSQMAIYVVARTMVTAGDTVAIEELSYPPAREAFRAAGANVVPIGLDAQGMKIAELEQLCVTRSVRAVYVTPHHQFPTTVLLTPERRLRLLALAERFGFTIVEDDYDHEFHFVHQPLLPLASADSDGKVVYIGSMSKLLTPSLRLGYLAAPRYFIEQAASEVLLIDHQGGQAIELAVAELINDGEIHRHARKAVRIYSERRKIFADLLRHHFGKTVTFKVPDGGLAFWVRFDRAIDLAAIEANAQRYGVRLQPAAAFAASGQAQSAARLGFANLDVQELGEAVGRLATAVRILTRA